MILLSAGEGGVNKQTTIVQFQLGVDQAISWFGLKSH